MSDQPYTNPFGTHGNQPPTNPFAAGATNTNPFAVPAGKSTNPFETSSTDNSNNTVQNNSAPDESPFNIDPNATPVFKGGESNQPTQLNTTPDKPPTHHFGDIKLDTQTNDNPFKVAAGAQSTNPFAAQNGKSTNPFKPIPLTVFEQASGGVHDWQPTQSSGVRNVFSNPPNADKNTLESFREASKKLGVNSNPLGNPFAGSSSTSYSFPSNVSGAFPKTLSTNPFAPVSSPTPTPAEVTGDTTPNPTAITDDLYDNFVKTMNDAELTDLYIKLCKHLNRDNTVYQEQVEYISANNPTDLTKLVIKLRVNEDLPIPVRTGCDTYLRGVVMTIINQWVDRFNAFINIYNTSLPPDQQATIPIINYLYNVNDFKDYNMICSVLSDMDIYQPLIAIVNRFCGSSMAENVSGLIALYEQCKDSLYVVLVFIRLTLLFSPQQDSITEKIIKALSGSSDIKEHLTALNGIKSDKGMIDSMSTSKSSLIVDVVGRLSDPYDIVRHIAKVATIDMNNCSIWTESVGTLNSNTVRLFTIDLKNGLSECQTKCFNAVMLESPIDEPTRTSLQQLQIYVRIQYALYLLDHNKDLSTEYDICSQMLDQSLYLPQSVLTVLITPTLLKTLQALLLIFPTSVIDRSIYSGNDGPNNVMLSLAEDKLPASTVIYRRATYFAQVLSLIFREYRDQLNELDDSALHRLCFKVNTIPFLEKVGRTDQDYLKFEAINDVFIKNPQFFRIIHDSFYIQLTGIANTIIQNANKYVDYYSTVTDNTQLSPSQKEYLRRHELDGWTYCSVYTEIQPIRTLQDTLRTACFSILSIFVRGSFATLERVTKYMDPSYQPVADETVSTMDYFSTDYGPTALKKCLSIIMTNLLHSAADNVIIAHEEKSDSPPKKQRLPDENEIGSSVIDTSKKTDAAMKICLVMLDSTMTQCLEPHISLINVLDNNTQPEKNRKIFDTVFTNKDWKSEFPGVYQLYNSLQRCTNDVYLTAILSLLTSNIKQSGDVYKKLKISHVSGATVNSRLRSLARNYDYNITQLSEGVFEPGVFDSIIPRQIHQEFEDNQLFVTKVRRIVNGDEDDLSKATRSAIHSKIDSLKAIINDEDADSEKKQKAEKLLDDYSMIRRMYSIANKASDTALMMAANEKLTETQESDAKFFGDKIKLDLESIQEATIKDLNEKHEAVVKGISDSNETLRSDYDTLIKKYEELEAYTDNQVSQSNEALVVAETQLATAIAEVARLQASLNEKTQELQNYVDANNDLQQSLANSQHEQTVHQSEISSLNTAISESQDALESRIYEIASLKQKIQVKSHVIDEQLKLTEHLQGRSHQQPTTIDHEGFDQENIHETSVNLEEQYQDDDDSLKDLLAEYCQEYYNILTRMPSTGALLVTINNVFELQPDQDNADSLRNVHLGRIYTFAMYLRYHLTNLIVEQQPELLNAYLDSRVLFDQDIFNNVADNIVDLSTLYTNDSDTIRSRNTIVEYLHNLAVPTDYLSLEDCGRNLNFIQAVSAQLYITRNTHYDYIDRNNTVWNAVQPQIYYEYLLTKAQTYRYGSYLDADLLYLNSQTFSDIVCLLTMQGRYPLYSSTVLDLAFDEMTRAYNIYDNSARLFNSNFTTSIDIKPFVSGRFLDVLNTNSYTYINPDELVKDMTVDYPDYKVIFEGFVKDFFENAIDVNAIKLHTIDPLISDLYTLASLNRISQASILIYCFLKPFPFNHPTHTTAREQELRTLIPDSNNTNWDNYIECLNKLKNFVPIFETNKISIPFYTLIDSFKTVYGNIFANSVKLTPVFLPILSGNFLRDISVFENHLELLVYNLMQYLFISIQVQLIGLLASGAYVYMKIRNVLANSPDENLRPTQYVDFITKTRPAMEFHASRPYPPSENDIAQQTIVVGNINNLPISPLDTSPSWMPESVDHRTRAFLLYTCIALKEKGQKDGNFLVRTEYSTYPRYINYLFRCDLKTGSNVFDDDTLTMATTLSHISKIKGVLIQSRDIFNRINKVRNVSVPCLPLTSSLKSTNEFPLFSESTINSLLLFARQDSDTPHSYENIPIKLVCGPVSYPDNNLLFRAVNIPKNLCSLGYPRLSSDKTTNYFSQDYAFLAYLKTQISDDSFIEKLYAFNIDGYSPENAERIKGIPPSSTTPAVDIINGVIREYNGLFGSEGIEIERVIEAGGLIISDGDSWSHTIAYPRFKWLIDCITAYDIYTPVNAHLYDNIKPLVDSAITGELKNTLGGSTTVSSIVDLSLINTLFCVSFPYDRQYIEYNLVQQEFPYLMLNPQSVSILIGNQAVFNDNDPLLQILKDSLSNDTYFGMSIKLNLSYLTKETLRGNMSSSLCSSSVFTYTSQGGFRQYILSTLRRIMCNFVSPTIFNPESSKYDKLIFQFYNTYKDELNFGIDRCLQSNNKTSCKILIQFAMTLDQYECKVVSD